MSIEVIRGNPSDYKVGPRHVGKGFEPTCRSFSHVTHTAHVRNAINAIGDQKLRADLVYDNSNLNQYRIRVVWMSPNSWNDGSRYGNVEFRFDWEQFSKGKKFYWVEVAEYKVNALRILVTTKEYTDHPIFKPYNPRDRSGPWWYDVDTNSHFYNGYYCLEFMIEDDVQIADVSEMGFTDHHRLWCNANRNTPKVCTDLGRSAEAAAAQFVGGLSMAGVSTELIRTRLGQDGRRGLGRAYRHVRERIMAYSEKAGIMYTGSVSGDGPLATPLARSMLAAVYRRDMDELKQVAELFKSADAAIEAVALGIERTFRVSGIPRTDDAFWTWDESLVVE